MPLAPLIIFILEQLIAKAPGIVVELRALFAKDNPTPEDWEKLRKTVEDKDYFSYVSTSKLPK